MGREEPDLCHIDYAWSYIYTRSLTFENIALFSKSKIASSLIHRAGSVRSGSQGDAFLSPSIEAGGSLIEFEGYTESTAMGAMMRS